MLISFNVTPSRAQRSWAEPWRVQICKLTATIVSKSINIGPFMLRSSLCACFQKLKNSTFYRLAIVAACVYAERVLNIHVQSRPATSSCCFFLQSVMRLCRVFVIPQIQTNTQLISWLMLSSDYSHFFPAHIASNLCDDVFSLQLITWLLMLRSRSVWHAPIRVIRKF